MAVKSFESFSVIVICYKRKDFLLNAVKSVLSQDYPSDKIQIIVVKAFYDNEVDSFLRENEVDVTFSDTAYYGKSVADALAIATGDIVCLLDDDDVFYSDKLSKISQTFQTDENIGTTVNNYNIIDKNGRAIESDFHRTERERQRMLGLRVFGPEDHDLAIMLNALRMTFNSSRICFKREITENRLNMISKISYMVDAIPAVLCLNDRKSIASLPEELSGYRIHENNISLPPEGRRDMEKLIAGHAKILNDADVLSEYFAATNLNLSRVYSFFSLTQKFKLAILRADKNEAMAVSPKLVKRLLENFGELLKYRALLITLPGSIFNLSFLPLIILSPRIARRLRLLFPV